MKLCRKVAISLNFEGLCRCLRFRSLLKHSSGLSQITSIGISCPANQNWMLALCKCELTQDWWCKISFSRAITLVVLCFSSPSLSSSLSLQLTNGSALRSKLSLEGAGAWPNILPAPPMFGARRLNIVASFVNLALEDFPMVRNFSRNIASSIPKWLRLENGWLWHALKDNLN